MVPVQIIYRSPPGIAHTMVSCSKERKSTWDKKFTFRCPFFSHLEELAAWHSLTIELNRRFLVDFGHYGWLVSRSLMGPKSGRAPRSVGQRSWHSLLDAPGNKFKGLLAYPIYPQWKTCLRHWKMESVLGSICSTWNLLFFSGLQHVGSAVRVCPNASNDPKVPTTCWGVRWVFT